MINAKVIQSILHRDIDQYSLAIGMHISRGLQVQD